jgi:small subunit ribosomal protein S4
VANYHGPVCRFCRREGAKLFLKGERCYTPKCAIERRAVPPGQHGQARRRKASDYGLQLRAKQKARRTYGLLEGQFRKYFERATREEGVTGLNLLRQLEMRLDNVVYRLGLAASRKQARQLVGHGHFQVNGRTVSIPSFLVRVGEEIKVEKRGPVIEQAQAAAGLRSVPSWLAFNEDELQGKVLALPDRSEMESGVEEHLIVEFYSR